MRELAENIDAGALGKAAIVASGGGFTLQWITDFGSLAVIAVNLVLGALGIVLVIVKIRNERNRGRTP